MKAVLLSVLFTCSGITSYTYGQGYAEPPDLPNTATGPVLNFSPPSITIEGQMNTPGDGSEYFMINLPSGCKIDSVTYSITDPNPVGISGYFQFGTNNQESFNGATSTSFANAGQFPTIPFPLNGPANLQCQAQANIAFQSDWNMVIHGSCGSCIDPTIPALSLTPSPVCPGDSAVITINGNLNDATAWYLYTDSCGGNPVDSTSINGITIGPQTTADYYIRGEGGCVIPGTCASVFVMVADTTPPTVICPGAQDLYINQNCEFIVQGYLHLLNYWDNCLGTVQLVQSPPSGLQIYSDTVVTYTLTDASNNVGQCSFQLNLVDTINPIDTAVIQNGNILTASNSNASYQWVDCSTGHAVIPGDTLQTCSTAQLIDGTYAVILTEFNCVDTSSCINVFTTNTNEPLDNYNIIIAPNPTSGAFTLNTGELKDEIVVSVRDILGNLIQQDVYQATGSIDMNIKESEGIYLLSVKSDNLHRIFKLVIR